MSFVRAKVGSPMGKRYFTAASCVWSSHPRSSLPAIGTKWLLGPFLGFRLHPVTTATLLQTDSRYYKSSSVNSWRKRSSLRKCSDYRLHFGGNSAWSGCTRVQSRSPQVGAESIVMLSLLGSIFTLEYLTIRGR